MSDTVVLPNSPVPGPKPGDVIAGRYRLERELGRGAMGTVWAALHTTLAQRVAIKLIVDEKARSADARQRFALEAKAAARLRSRHVVQIYDDGETPDGTPYIVMEYLEGRTLEQRLDAQRDIGLGEAVRIASHVGRALARAHAHGIVHRDLKPGNIFIAKTEDDELGWVAKVLDFGVAKLLTESAGPSATRTGTIVGTPLFMSPEQIRGAAHVDHRADLYSLGMVFYNMVTGSHAFDGPSYSDVLVAICTQPLPDIRSVAPWLPPSLGAWFDKACAREREHRFQSADEMIDALQQAAGPGTRLSRPSVPDEIGGPSGTLVGHVPPHTASTLLVQDYAAPGSSSTPLASRGAEPPSPRAGGSAPSSRRPTTLRSHPPEPTAVTPARAHASLWLWAASGAGLALATTGLALVVTRAAALWRDPRPTSVPPSSSAPVSATTITHSAPPSAAAVVPTARPPMTPPVTASSPPELASAPTASESTPHAGRPADARVSPPRRAASAPHRTDATVVPAAKAPVIAASAPARPSTAAAAPDMGF